MHPGLSHEGEACELVNWRAGGAPLRIEAHALPTFALVV